VSVRQIDITGLFQSVASAQVTVTTPNAITANGNTFTNGTAGYDIINGSAGDDRVIAGAGNDLMTNFAAGDIFLGGDGVDYVRLNQVNYLHESYLHIGQITSTQLSTVVGESMSSAVVANQIGLRLFDFNNTNNVITTNIGFTQAEVIYLVDSNGLVADELVIGTVYTDSNGNDTMGLRLSNQGHSLLAGTADDNILAGYNNDVIHGNGGNDLIFGGEGNDILAAGAWSEASQSFDSAPASSYAAQLFGGEGTDVLVAAEGRVEATGGAGADTFAFFGSQANQSIELFIKDFSAVAGDRIDISKIVGGSSIASILGDAAKNTVVAATGVRTVDLSDLTLDTTDTLVLKIAATAQNTPITLQNSDFLTAPESSDSWFSSLSPLVYANHG
jgi:Ca2+-binding RTX toxin-like protein